MKSRSICVVLAIIVLGWLYFVPPSYEPLGYDEELSCAPLAFAHSGHGKGDKPDSDLVERRYRKYYGSSGSSDVDGDRDDDLKKEADSVVEDWKEGCRLVREDRQALLNMASVLFATIFLSLSISQRSCPRNLRGMARARSRGMARMVWRPQRRRPLRSERGRGPEGRVSSAPRRIPAASRTSVHRRGHQSRSRRRRR